MKIQDLFNNNEPYVIAEIAQNHDGSLGMAHAFIDAVSKTGADAIKFQTHIASAESTIHEPFRVNFSYCDKTRYDYWKRMEFSEEQWEGLFEHATMLGLDFLSSPFSLEALHMLNRIGIPAWKFGSGEVFNSILLNEAIKTQKTIILSTGLSTYNDIDEQVKLIKKAGNNLIIMECTTAYPSKAENIPILQIKNLKDRYGCIVGISDHSSTIFPALSAITLGAQCVEVHVTFSRDMFGPDVKASVTVDELKQIVEGAKFIQAMLNCNNKKDQLDEEKSILRNTFSKSIYANKKMCKEHLLTEGDLGIKKPYNESGILLKDYYSVIGKKLKIDVDSDEILTWEKIQ